MAYSMPTTRRFSVDSELRGAKPAKTVYELSDSIARGLRLRIQPSGTKVFWYTYKDAAKKVHRIKIGEYGNRSKTTLTKARARRDELAGMRDDPMRLDPADFIAQKAAEKAARDVDAARDAEKSRWTAKEVVSAYLASLEGRKRPNTQRVYRQILERHLVEKMADTPFVDITEELICELCLDPIEARGKYSQRDLTRVVMLGMFAWARSRKRNKVAPVLHGMNNPVRDIEPLSKNDIPEGYGNAKDNCPPAVLAALWSTLKTVPRSKYDDVLILQLTTGIRVSEAYLAEWEHIDLDAQEWRIPASITKNRVAHVLPLNRHAVAMLDAREGDRTGRVFRGGKESTRISKRFVQLLAELNIEPSRYGTHSLRKSVATTIVELGYPQEVRRYILNHTPGGSDSLEKTDVKARWKGAATKALDDWANYLDALVEGKVTRIS